MAQFLSEEEFKQFRDLIYRESGIHFCDSNRMVLESRLKEILREYKLATVADYFRLVMGNPEEIKKLLDAVTTNLTRFFRNDGHFSAFRKHVVPQVIKHKYKTGDLSFTFWSAGCSTGEECYSIAMVLDDMLPSEFNIRVIGSDISLTSLMTAKEGRYRKDRLKDVSPEYLRRYFTKDGDDYVVADHLRDKVQFDYHNLKFKTSLVNNDVVFCRNVLIYFDEAAQVSVVNKVWDTMSPFSFFFIGHSESLFGMDTKFEFLKTDWACLYTKNVGSTSYE